MCFSPETLSELCQYPHSRQASDMVWHMVFSFIMPLGMCSSMVHMYGYIHVSVHTCAFPLAQVHTLFFIIASALAVFYHGSLLDTVCYCIFSIFPNRIIASSLIKEQVGALQGAHVVPSSTEIAQHHECFSGFVY